MSKKMEKASRNTLIDGEFCSPSKAKPNRLRDNINLPVNFEQTLFWPHDRTGHHRFYHSYHDWKKNWELSEEWQLTNIEALLSMVEKQAGNNHKKTQGNGRKHDHKKENDVNFVAPQVAQNPQPICFVTPPSPYTVYQRSVTYSYISTKTILPSLKYVSPVKP